MHVWSVEVQKTICIVFNHWIFLYMYSTAHEVVHMHGDLQWSTMDGYIGREHSQVITP
jgi:hypothetical protein